MNDIVKRLIDYEWKPLNRDMSLNDYISITKLLDIIAKDKFKMCEIGTRQGSSTALFASYAKLYNTKVYTIDSYLGIWDTKNEFYKNMKNLDLTGYVELLHMSSKEANLLLSDEEFDFVFIDGNHIYPHIKEDIEIWLPRVKKGGILCGHDCEILLKNGLVDLKEFTLQDPDLTHRWNNWDTLCIHAGVVYAVCEKFGDKVKIEGDRIWWVRKT